jgi:hypothetical protein
MTTIKTMRRDPTVMSALLCAAVIVLTRVQWKTKETPLFDSLVQPMTSQLVVMITTCPLQTLHVPHRERLPTQSVI